MNFFGFARQQWLHESASVLRYTYIACRVDFCNHVSHIKSDIQSCDKSGIQTWQC